MEDSLNMQKVVGSSAPFMFAYYLQRTLIISNSKGPEFSV